MDTIPTTVHRVLLLVVLVCFYSAGMYLVLGRPFVKRFPYAMSVLCVCPVCDVGALAKRLDGSR